MLRDVTTDRLDDAHAAGRPALGAWMVAPTEVTLGIVAATELDFVCVDTQHSLVTEAEAGRLSHGTSVTVTTLVRTSANDTALIGRVLDAGANGVIVPMVEDGAQAAAAVAACRYPPQGIRSWGPCPAPARARSSTRERAHRDDRVGPRAREHGRDRGDRGARRRLRRAERPLDRARLHVVARRPAGAHRRGDAGDRRSVYRTRIIAGTHPTTGEGGAWAVSLGFGMVAVAVDTGLLAAGVARELSAARRG